MIRFANCPNNSVLTLRWRGASLCAAMQCFAQRDVLECLQEPVQCDAVSDKDTCCAETPGLIFVISKVRDLKYRLSF